MPLHLLASIMLPLMFPLHQSSARSMKGGGFCKVYAKIRLFRFVQGWDKDAKVVAAAWDKGGALVLFFTKPCACSKACAPYFFGPCCQMGESSARPLKHMAIFDDMTSSLEQRSHIFCAQWSQPWSVPGGELIVALVSIWGSQILFIHKWLCLMGTLVSLPRKGQIKGNI